MSYYNSTPLTGKDLQTATGLAKAQDERILDYFKLHPSKRFSPEDLQHLFHEATPLTSLRRSFTSLTKGLFIYKTGWVKQGKFGRKVNTWSLKTNNNQLQLL